MLRKIIHYQTSPSASFAVLHLLHAFNSDDFASLFVTRQVSSDLQNSVIHEPDFDSVPWPSDNLFVEFEDPSLPNFLISRDDKQTMQWVVRTIKGVEYTLGDDVATGFHLNFCVGDGKISAAMGSSDDLNKMARGEAETRTEGLCEEKQQEREELAAEVQPLMLLFFKVLMFAACPKFTPVEKVRKFGKPAPGALRIRDMKQWVVQYLPRHIKEKDEESEALGKSREFCGRYGHWRVYKDERFINKKGQRDYIWPIPDPKGRERKRKFVVRNPK